MNANEKGLRRLAQPLCVARLTLLVYAAGEKSTIDNERLSSNERRGIGGEKDCSSYKFFCSAEAPHGRAHQ